MICRGHFGQRAEFPQTCIDRRYLSMKDRETQCAVVNSSHRSPKRSAACEKGGRESRAYVTKNINIQSDNALTSKHSIFDPVEQYYKGMHRIAKWERINKIKCYSHCVNAAPQLRRCHVNRPSAVCFKSLRQTLFHLLPNSH